jgi:hypothetical protein
MIIPIVAGAVAVAFLGGVAFIATRPNEFRVVREALIKAPPEVVFSYVDDLRKWDDWSPWAKLDPNCKMTYGEIDKGKGASYQWNGNNKVGEGRLTVVESRPFSELGLRLEFIRPFQCENDVDFTFKAEQGGTRVIWGMNGKNNLMSKTMCLVMNMDKMVGKDFEKGLTSLRAIAENGAK